MTATNPISRSGRFERGPSEDVVRYSQSVSFDQRLWQQDIVGTVAHARMLCARGILDPEELDAILNALEAIGNEIASGAFEWNERFEDVHMNIEAALTRRVPAGAKIHTARSRNDQVAVDIRMWLRDEIAELIGEIQDGQRALVHLAERERNVILPGYTHLQRAQPVLLAHHLLAYAEMLERDRDRMGDCFHRTNVCPLGSGALAGSTLQIDRQMVAKELGFVDAKGTPRLTRNSMDAVSDRDFVVEFCGAGALLAVHLSRLAEDLVLWSSAEFGFIRLSDTYTTGSSLMPQKKNPDVAEIGRGKTGRVIGNLVSILTTLKGLPMAYNRDLQEDKERLFDTADTVRSTLRVFSSMLECVCVNRDRCLEAASDPALLATDWVDYLVSRQVPFRHAHHIVGKVVALAEKERKPLDEVTTAELQSIDERFAEDAVEVFDLPNAMARRRLYGSSGKEQVFEQIQRWKDALAKGGGSPGSDASDDAL